MVQILLQAQVALEVKISSAEVCQKRGIQVEILDAKHTLDLDKFVLEKDHSIKSTTIVPN